VTSVCTPLIRSSSLAVIANKGLFIENSLTSPLSAIIKNATKEPAIRLKTATRSGLTGIARNHEKNAKLTTIKETTQTIVITILCDIGVSLVSSSGPGIKTQIIKLVSTLKVSVSSVVLHLLKKCSLILVLVRRVLPALIIQANCWLELSASI